MRRQAPTPRATLRLSQPFVRTVGADSISARAILRCRQTPRANSVRPYIPCMVARRGRRPRRPGQPCVTTTLLSFVGADSISARAILRCHQIPRANSVRPWNPALPPNPTNQHGKPQPHTIPRGVGDAAPYTQPCGGCRGAQCAPVQSRNRRTILRADIESAPTPTKIWPRRGQTVGRRKSVKKNAALLHFLAFPSNDHPFGVPRGEQPLGRGPLPRNSGTFFVSFFGHKKGKPCGRIPLKQARRRRVAASGGHPLKPHHPQGRHIPEY